MHAEQEECEAHIPQMETELEDQEENIQGVDQALAGRGSLPEYSRVDAGNSP